MVGDKMVGLLVDAFSDVFTVASTADDIFKSRQTISPKRGKRQSSKIPTKVREQCMDNKYERLAEDMSDVAARLAQLMHRLPFDMKMARGTGGAQVAYDSMALERMSLRLIDQVFLGKRNNSRPWLGPQEDPCVRAIQSLQGVFTNIARLDQAVSYWPDSDSLSEDIATLLRMAATLLEEDLAQTLDARRTQVTERLAAWDREHTRFTVEDGSETFASDRSLSILASSAEEQAAGLEAMLNFEYAAQAGIAPAAETAALVADKPAQLRRWRKFVSIFEK
jgi:hypothetical protein